MKYNQGGENLEISRLTRDKKRLSMSKLKELKRSLTLSPTGVSLHKNKPHAAPAEENNPK